MKGMLSKAFVLTLVLSGVVSASVPVSQVATPSRWESFKAAATGAKNYVVDSRVAGYASSFAGRVNNVVVAPYNAAAALVAKVSLTDYVSNIGFVKNDKFYNATVGNAVSKVAPYAVAAAIAYAAYRGYRYFRPASKEVVYGPLTKAETEALAAKTTEVIVSTGSVAYDSALKGSTVVPVVKPVDVKIEVIEKKKPATPAFNAKAARDTSEALAAKVTENKKVQEAYLADLTQAHELLEQIVKDLSTVERPADLAAKYAKALAANTWLNEHNFSTKEKATVKIGRSSRAYGHIVHDTLTTDKMNKAQVIKNISNISAKVAKQKAQYVANLEKYKANAQAGTIVA